MVNSANATKNQTQSQLPPPLSIIRMLWKKRWLALAIWIVGTIVAGAVVRLLPSVYQAEAVVLVDSQKIPESFVTPTVGGDIADRLALISQDIMSTDRLLDVINRFDLYRDERSRLTQEELLRKMRQDISVNVEKSWTGGRMQAFRLGYQGRNAKVVADVANRLAGLYVAENTRARESQAEDTVSFLRRQLQDAKKSLDDQEAKVALFKQEHNGTLPQQESSLLASLSGSRIELQGVQDSIARGQENKSSLEAALSSAESSEAAIIASLQSGSKPSPRAIGDPAKPAATRTEVLQEQLRGLRLRYTEDYPEVQSVLHQLQQAKQEEAEALSAARADMAKAASKDQAQAAVEKMSLVTPELLRTRERVSSLKAQIEAVKRQLAISEAQRQQLSASIADLEARINKLPLVEQQMASLKRGYDESANNYNSLLQKELAADMATDMERSHKSEHFTVIDPARVPQKPIKPKRAVLAAGGSFGGLVLGLLIGFGLEFRKQTFLGEWELPAGTVVLGRVPLIHSSAKRSRHAVSAASL